ncbi:hypothetical protein FOZ61_004985, partial [Perkinsus olseni]
LLLETIEAVGLPRDFIKQNCVSLSTDGEYVNLGVGDKLNALLGLEVSAEGPQVYHGWDVAHRLELCHSDAHKLVDIRGKLHDEMPSHFGASYERIKRAADELNTRFYAPVAFCKTRWCASERRVFLNFKSNLLAIHRSDDDDPKAAYLDVRWVFTFVVMLDVLEHMSRASLLAQR